MLIKFVPLFDCGIKMHHWHYSLTFNFFPHYDQLNFILVPSNSNRRMHLIKTLKFKVPYWSGISIMWGTRLIQSYNSKDNLSIYSFTSIITLVVIFLLWCLLLVICFPAEYCLPLVRVGGMFIAAKGHDPEVCNRC